MAEGLEFVRPPRTARDPARTRSLCAVCYEIRRRDSTLLSHPARNRPSPYCGGAAVDPSQGDGHRLGLWRAESSPAAAIEGGLIHKRFERA